MEVGVRKGNRSLKMLQKLMMHDLSKTKPAQLSPGSQRTAQPVRELGPVVKSGLPEPALPLAVPGGSAVGLQAMTKVLRIGSAKVGSMSTRHAEVVNMAARRRLDFCCLQETRWQAESCRCIKGDGVRCKFFWKGCKESTAGLGVLVAEK